MNLLFPNHPKDFPFYLTKKKKKKKKGLKTI